MLLRELAARAFGSTDDVILRHQDKVLPSLISKDSSRMPLHYADESIDPVTLKTVPERFIIFYASIVNGEMWCPECRRVEGLVKNAFSDSGPDGLVVYVGTRSQWKTPENVYRHEPWKISNIPTIVKKEDDGTEVGRLGDEISIRKDLLHFIKS